jgi:hypothetical protein
VRRIVLAIVLAVASAPAQAPRDGATVWKVVRDGLIGPDSAEFWKIVKDSLLPSPPLARDRFRGVVLSSEPSDHPILLRIAMYGATTPELTIKLPRPLKASYPPGTDVLFKGVAREFTREPFMLTLEVDQDQYSFVEKESSK